MEANRSGILARLGDASSTSDARGREIVQLEERLRLQAEAHLARQAEI